MSAPLHTLHITSSHCNKSARGLEPALNVVHCWGKDNLKHMAAQTCYAIYVIQASPVVCNVCFILRTKTVEFRKKLAKM